MASERYKGSLAPETLDDILKPDIIRFRGVILFEKLVHERIFIKRMGPPSRISGNYIIASYA